MKTVLFTCALSLFGMVIYRCGVVNERLEIKATCESDDTPLVINNVEYLCLSQRHLQMIQRRRNQKDA